MDEFFEIFFADLLEDMMFSVFSWPISLVLLICIVIAYFYFR